MRSGSLAANVTCASDPDSDTTDTDVDCAPVDVVVSSPNLTVVSGPTVADADLADEAAYGALALSLGVPDPALDCTPDKTFPLEADFDLLNAIDFHKGCYVGQETTSRMKRRSAVKTRMAPIVFEGPPPPVGTFVMVGDLRAGEVLSGAPGRAMAMAEEGALEADRTAHEILRQLPKTDDAALLAIAEKFRGQEGAKRFDLLFERLADQVREMAVRSAGAGETGGLDRWAAVWERLVATPGEVEAVNLDRVDAFWTTMAQLRDAAKA